MDQRRVDGFMDLMRRVAFGDQLPQARAGNTEVGIVVHADTLFGDGPAKNDPGEIRGLGAPAPIDPHSARELASAQIDTGAATRVLLVDGCGHPAAQHPAPQRTAGRADPTRTHHRGPQRTPGPTRPGDRVLRADRGDHRPRPSGAPEVHLV